MSGYASVVAIRERNTVLASHMFFFFSSRRRHTIFKCDWSSDVCSSDLRFQHALVHVCNHRRDPAHVEIFLARTILAFVQLGHILLHRLVPMTAVRCVDRSEERRVGKECRSRGWPYHLKKKKKRMYAESN